MTADFSAIFISSFAGLAIGNALLSIFVLTSLKAASKERAQLNKEMFGLVRKIEGLTASRREQFLKEYDKILENLTRRLPPTIAAQASQNIFDMESRILTRLAELEPSLKSDGAGLKKMDALIQSMEKLEQSLVSSTADTVQKILIESRSALAEDGFGEIEM